jgi:acetyl-CoA synthetase
LIAMLACARIGAVHCVVFGGLSAQALAQRLVDCGAVCVVTQDECVRGEKVVPLKEIYDTALTIMREQGHNSKSCNLGCNMMPAIVFGSRLGGDAEALPLSFSSVPMGERDTWWHEELAACGAECETEWVDAEDPAFILYTSGSTGKPNGIVHAVGGFMVGAAVSFKYVFDTQPGDVWWCTADVGWVTGHTYVTYGPLLNGATQVVFEGSLFHPTAARAWEIVDKYEVSHLYTAPTFIRSCMSAGSDLVQDSSSRESLRLLGSVGEPINPEVIC